jgi:hypothetical protein
MSTVRRMIMWMLMIMFLVVIMSMVMIMRMKMIMTVTRGDASGYRVDAIDLHLDTPGLRRHRDN